MPTAASVESGSKIDSGSYLVSKIYLNGSKGQCRPYASLARHTLQRRTQFEQEVEGRKRKVVNLWIQPQK